MAITINGSGTITGVSAGGLPDGSVTADDLASTLDISGKTVTLPSDVGGITTGKVLQIVETSFDTHWTYASSSDSNWQTVTPLQLSITPSSSSNKILVIVNLQFGGSGNTYGGFRLRRGSTAIFTGVSDASGQREVTIPVDIPGGGNTDYKVFSSSGMYLDSPASTSQVDYSFQAGLNSGYTIFTNRSLQNDGGRCVTQSSMTLMEIAG